MKTLALAAGLVLLAGAGWSLYYLNFAAERLWLEPSEARSIAARYAGEYLDGYTLEDYDNPRDRDHWFLYRGQAGERFDIYIEPDHAGKLVIRQAQRLTTP